MVEIQEQSKRGTGESPSVEVATQRAPAESNRFRAILFAGFAVYSLYILGKEFTRGQDAVRPYLADVSGTVWLQAINTTLSAGLLGAAGLLCLVAAQGARVDRPQRRFFLLLTAGFLYLGCDDRFLLHEMIGAALRIPDALFLGAIGAALATLLYTHRTIWLPARGARSFLWAAATLTGIMLLIDLFGPARMPMRLSVEDLTKTWASLCFALFAWSLCMAEIDPAGRARRA